MRISTKNSSLCAEHFSRSIGQKLKCTLKVFTEYSEGHIWEKQLDLTLYCFANKSKAWIKVGQYVKGYKLIVDHNSLTFLFNMLHINFEVSVIISSWDIEVYGIGHLVVKRLLSIKVQTGQFVEQCVLEQWEKAFS